jgi:archaellum biogenesis protein FlaJ (TadC family)
MESSNCRHKFTFMTHEEIVRIRSRGHISQGDLFAFSLLLAVILSPFVVAFWILGIITPRTIKDWFVDISYLVLFVATICFLLLLAYALIKKKISQRKSDNTKLASETSLSVHPSVCLSLSVCLCVSVCRP